MLRLLARNIAAAPGRPSKNVLLCQRALAQQTIASASRGDARAPLRYSKGDKVHGFVVKDVIDAPDFNAKAFVLQHERIGSQYLHVDTADTNNVFSVAFRTPPTDSTGVAHILEHTALCGSKLFPVRDPFFNMLRRSLSTFMNAWTTPDHTMYPFMTGHAMDYHNLLRVYLDAALRPVLAEDDFRQEGHRFEFETIDDPKSALSVKGVVYNEMKGAMSDNSSIFMQRLQELTHPNSPYSFNSGGEPADIPKLTWQQLRAFHKRNYHPTNALFYSYGDLPLEHHLEVINNEGLAHFERSSFDPRFNESARLQKPQTHFMTAPPDTMAADPDKQTKMAVSWLTGDNSDAFHSFSMQMLSMLLTSGPQAPLYKSLVDSNIGAGYAPGTGYDPNCKTGSFTVGVQGLASNDEAWQDAVKRIDETLTQVAQEGFPRERIDAVRHQIELSLKHKTNRFGLNLAQTTIPHWINGGRPEAALQVNQLLEALEQKLAAGPYFQTLIKELMLANSHRVTLVMRPDAEYLAQQEQKERALIAAAEAALTETDRQRIVREALVLKSRQEEKQNVDVLPTLSVSEIPRTRTMETIIHQTGVVPQQLLDQPTNGVVYMRALFENKALPAELEMYLPIFCSLVGQLSTTQRSYQDLSQLVDMTTGGFHLNEMVVHDPLNAGQFKQHVLLTSHALTRNTEKMFDVLQEVLSGTLFDDVERVNVLVNQTASYAASSVTDSGHTYARSLAASVLTKAAYVQERFSGITQVQFLTQLAAKDVDAETAEKFKAISRHLRQNLVRVGAVAEASAMTQASSFMNNFSKSVISTKNNNSSSQWREREPVELPQISERKGRFVQLPAQVNFVSRVIDTHLPFTNEDTARLTVLGKVMSNGFLHREIREKGGAYGGGAAFGYAVFPRRSFPPSDIILSICDLSVLNCWTVLFRPLLMLTC
eukprot:TRINITY_DN2702_c0_g1_i3.p1 TRINITY_DN2702_c0_g1~~TRINITY_DN2702_c0_g1_i3.p1  ORF type:complete len:935 (+),score=217.45 TRINITY_DN2702_c0_g1_i3:3-2807(+)